MSREALPGMVVPRAEAGAGEPAVVLEAGMNCGAASWQRVMPLLARTCALPHTTGRG
jgi:hypothetical protein